MVHVNDLTNNRGVSSKTDTDDDARRREVILVDRVSPLQLLNRDASRKSQNRSTVRNAPAVRGSLCPSRTTHFGFGVRVPSGNFGTVRGRGFQPPDIVTGNRRFCLCRAYPSSTTRASVETISGQLAPANSRRIAPCEVLVEAPNTRNMESAGGEPMWYEIACPKHTAEGARLARDDVYPPEPSAARPLPRPDPRKPPTGRH